MSQFRSTHLRHTATTVSLTARCVVLLLALWQASHMLLLLFGGVLLAVLLRGLGDLISDCTGINPDRAVWIVLIAIVVLFGAGGWYLAGEIAGQFDALGESLSSTWDRTRSWLQRHAWGAQVLAFLGDPAISAERVGALRSVITSVLGGISGLVISVFIGVYIAADPTP